MSAATAPAPPKPTILKVIEVYVCPEPNCPDYYGSANMPKLEDEWTGVKIEDRHQTGISVYEDAPQGMRHPRSECPTCRVKGKHVLRVRRTVTVAV